VTAKTRQTTKPYREDTALSADERRRLLEGGYREVGFGPDGTPTVARGDEPWTLTLKPRKHYAT
jgi:hypothetical protein